MPETAMPGDRPSALPGTAMSGGLSPSNRGPRRYGLTRMRNDDLTIPSELGTIRISAGAVADLVARIASRCYGVVGLASRTRVGRLLGRERAASAVSVEQDGDRMRIGLHVVVEYGLNLAEVAATLRSQVSYELERLTGMRVATVDVHIENARRSAS